MKKLKILWLRVEATQEAHEITEQIKELAKEYAGPIKTKVYCVDKRSIVCGSKINENCIGILEKKLGKENIKLIEDEEYTENGEYISKSQRACEKNSVN